MQTDMMGDMMRDVVKMINIEALMYDKKELVLAKEIRKIKSDNKDYRKMYYQRMKMKKNE